MSGAVPRPPAAHAALGGYLQISARGRHRLRSVRFVAPAPRHRAGIEFCGGA